MQRIQEELGEPVRRREREKRQSDKKMKMRVYITRPIGTTRKDKELPDCVVDPEPKRRKSVARGLQEGCKTFDVRNRLVRL